MVEKALSQISLLFTKIEVMIQEKFENNLSNEDEIKKVFKQIKEIMDEEIEAIDSNEYNHLKYVFHSKSSAFYQVIGLEKEAQNHEKLAQKNEIYSRKNYKKQPKKSVEEEKKNNEKKEVSALFADADEKDIQTAEKEELANLLPLIGEEAIKPISEFLTLAKRSPNTFIEYQAMRKIEMSLKTFLKEINLRIEDPNNPEQSKRTMESTIIIQKIAEHWFYFGKLEFVRKLIGSSYSKELLFGDIIQTEEEIIRRYRDLALFFHPDKALWIKNNEDRELIQELFVQINEIKSSIMEKFETHALKVGKLAFYENEGNDYWKIGKEFQKASKGDWQELKILHKEDVSHMTPQELKNNSNANINLAFAKYRSCCRIADQNKILKKRLEMRGYLALCRYSLGSYLEAQLYAISCFLIIMDSKEATNADLNEARKIFEKVKKNECQKDVAFPKFETSLALIEENQLQIALKPVAESFTYMEKENIKSSIEEDLRKVSRELVLRSDRTLIRYDLDHSSILVPVQQNEKVLRQFYGGQLTFDFMKNNFIPTFLLNPISAAIFISMKLFVFRETIILKKHAIKQETDIRQSIEKCILEALDEYDKGNMDGFIKAITSELAENGERLLKYAHVLDTIVPETVIQQLLDHGMRPDGAAYILNSIGEALISGKVKVEGKSVEDHEAEAVKIFNSLLIDEKENILLRKAKELDELLKKKKLESFKTSKKIFFWNFIKVLFTRSQLFDESLDQNSIAQEDMEDAKEMSFESRLAELQYVARINLLLVRITQKGWNKSELGKIRKEIFDQNRICMISKERMDALEDFIWAMKGETFSEEKEEDLTKSKMILDNPSYKETPEPPNFCEGYVNYLKQCIQNAENNEEKENMMLKMAEHYEFLAQKEEKEKKMKTFFFWQKAHISYNEIMKRNQDHQLAFLGSIKCLIKMAKFKQVLTLLKSTQSKILWFTPEFWMLGSIAYRKQNNYSKALDFILEAKKLDYGNPEIQKEIDLIKKIRTNNVEAKIATSKENKLVYEEKYFSSRKTSFEYYKILSIDGGGIRGIIPAFWLMEIERKIRKPISHLFNMLAGTSTGAIISAGLSCPLNQFTPKYTACDLIEIYRNGRELFSKGNLFMNPFHLMKSQYTDNGRLSAFKHYFGDLKLNQCLNELVIPAVWENDLTTTFRFSTFDAKLDDSANFPLVDILMATSAAPTFFPPYKIDGMGTFLDGGIHANNPIQMAYHETLAFQNPKGKIWALSLGTGSYIPEHLGQIGFRGKLFWAKNLVNVTLSQQEGNIDSQMFNELGKNYNRWQVWLEDQITLDDYRETQIEKLLEIAQEHIEELYYSEENSMNKVFEMLCTDPF